jgi:cytosine deaminase
MRSYGDVDSISKLESMYPVLEAKEKFSGLVDAQFVPFPQLGFVRDPESVTYMRSAMQEGAGVVEGMPHHETSLEDAARHIDICFEIAKGFNADIDMHIDETDDPDSRKLGVLAEATIREEYQGRVTAGHC